MPSQRAVLKALEKQKTEVEEISGKLPGGSPEMKPHGPSTQKQRSMMPQPQEQEEEKTLDDLLDEANAQADQQEQQQQESTLDDELRQVFDELDDAPSEQQIEAWKHQFGQEAVNLLVLDQDNVYVFTYLSLEKWEKIQSTLQRLQQQQQQDPHQQQLIQKQISEKVIRTAVLWPELPAGFFQKNRAGLRDTLYQLIMVQSYFLSPQQAMTLTTQL